jgi:DNA invertase Pin-like site-specific DNA recombinase
MPLLENPTFQEMVSICIRCFEKVALRFSKTALDSFFSFPHIRSEYRESDAQRRLQPMRIGYARVSTRGQNLEMQFDVLAKAACPRIFNDKLSGALDERPGLKEALSHLREGDTLVVWKLDRLGCSVKGLADPVNELEARKVHFQSVTDGIDTKTPSGRFFFQVMASLAQMERELILERTRAGLEDSRLQGRFGGRKRQMTNSKVQAARKLLASGTPPREVAHSQHVSVPTLYRWLPASPRT